jgi:Protein of unknown function (DUF2589)
MATSKTAKKTAVKKTTPSFNGLKTSVENLPGNLDGLSKQEAVTQLKKTVSLARQLAAAGPLGPQSMAPTTNFSSELNNIDFRKMIGGPLQACVDAQVASSIATVDFINKVGFAEVNGKKELVMVDFSHTRKDVDSEGKEVSKAVSIRVPLLAMLPIPSLRIEHAIIIFNVKLNSVETSDVSDKLGISASVQGGFGPVSFKVSASYQRQSSSGVKVEKEYALNINVKCVQDEIPAGLEKILGMLAA